MIWNHVLGSNDQAAVDQDWAQLRRRAAESTEARASG